MVCLPLFTKDVLHATLDQVRKKETFGTYNVLLQHILRYLFLSWSNSGTARYKHIDRILIVKDSPGSRVCFLALNSDIPGLFFLLLTLCLTKSHTTSTLVVWKNLLLNKNFTQVPDWRKESLLKGIVQIFLCGVVCGYERGERLERIPCWSWSWFRCSGVQLGGITKPGLPFKGSFCILLNHINYREITVKQVKDLLLYFCVSQVISAGN